MHTLKNCLEGVKKVLNQKNHKLFSLVSLGDLVAYKLLSTARISIKDKKVLYLFVKLLRSYTYNSGTNSSKYSKDFEYNTCDYKIARELTLRFEGHPFEVLADWINHYYFDCQLWHRAVDQMIEINPIKGLALGVEYARPSTHESVEWFQKSYWKRLVKYKPSFEDIRNLALKSDIPLFVSKEVCKFVIENNLLDTLGSKEYYLYLFTKVTLKAKDGGHYEILRKKEDAKLIKLARAIKRD